jgi:hypothetical protein
VINVVNIIEYLKITANRKERDESKNKARLSYDQTDQSVKEGRNKKEKVFDPLVRPEKF